MYEYRTLIVGVQMALGAVKRVWVRNDGGMTDGGLIHYPADWPPLSGPMEC